MNECERLEQFSKRLINVWGLDSKRIEIWKKWRIRRENKNLWTLREYKIQGKGLRIKFHRWCETQVLIGWNFLVSHHDIEYSFVFTPCYQSPLCFTCSILANSSKTLHQSSNKDSVSMCCLLLGYNSNAGLTAVRFVQRAHRLWPSIYQTETDVRTLNTSLTGENKIDKFRSSRFGDFIRLGANFPPHWGCFFNSLRNQLC